MKPLPLLTLTLASLTLAQTPSPYTDPKSNLTFTLFQHPSGTFFGLALAPNSTSFTATLGGKGTGYTGISLGGGMLNKLLLLAWPNGQTIVASLRKTATYASPTAVTGSFAQRVIANGAYVNATHWTYTFVCEGCVRSDGSTFRVGVRMLGIGVVGNPSAPAKRGDEKAGVARHTEQGQVVFDLEKGVM